MQFSELKFPSEIDMTDELPRTTLGPHCGALLKGVWPPPPAGPEGRIYTGLPPGGKVSEGAIRQYYMLIAAFAITIGGWLAVMWTIYLRQRPQYPRFVRGFGYSLIALLIFLVSMTLFCGGL